MSVSGSFGGSELRKLFFNSVRSEHPVCQNKTVNSLEIILSKHGRVIQRDFVTYADLVD